MLHTICCFRLMRTIWPIWFIRQNFNCTKTLRSCIVICAHSVFFFYCNISIKFSTFNSRNDWHTIIKLEIISNECCSHFGEFSCRNCADKFIGFLIVNWLRHTTFFCINIFMRWNFSISFPARSMFGQNQPGCRWLSFVCVSIEREKTLIFGANWII